MMEEISDAMTIIPWAHKLLKATSHEKDFFRILPIETVLREQGVSYSIPYVFIE